MLYFYPMNISRLALKEVRSWFSSPHRLPLIIKGARQVGKTHLVREFLNLTGLPHVAINFEREPNCKSAFSSSLQPDDILLNLELVGKRGATKAQVVFLDEVQECPEALNSLKYFAEERPDVAVIGAGSLLGVALSESSFPVGKVSYLWLGPLRFEEFLSAHNDTVGIEALDRARRTLQVSASAHMHLWDKLKLFYVSGGLPAAVRSLVENEDHLPTAMQRVRSVQEGLIRDYQSDFSKHSARANALHIRRIYEAIPYQLAKVEDGTSAKFTFEHTIPGRRGYAQLAAPIDWVEKAGMVYKVPIANRSEQPLTAFCKENTFKLYPFDVGMLGAQLNLPPELLLTQNFGMTKGYFAETLVLQGLITSDLSRPVCWSEGTSEVEFLLPVGREIVPIEVKSSTRTKAKSLAAYIKRYSPAKAIKFYAGLPMYNSAVRLHSLPLYLAWDTEEIARGL